MAKDKDVFGFEELEKSFKRLEKRYPNQADAMLMAQGQAANKRTKALTPVKTKKLRNSWRLKKVKLYKGGTVRVVRVQSNAPHAHLVEYGHDLYRGGKVYVSGHEGVSTGRRGGYKRKLNRYQRRARGTQDKGKIEGTHMLEYAVTEAGQRFPLQVQKMLDRLIESEGF